MSGLELCRQLRGLPGYDRTLIVVLTGLRDLADLKQVLDAGPTTIGPNRWIWPNSKPD